MRIPDHIRSIPPLAEVLDKSNHAHAIIVKCDKDLREFTAAAMSYMPGWMRFMYRVRAQFVRLLGAPHDAIPDRNGFLPEDVSFTPGDPASFFTVVAGEEDYYWIAEASDSIINGSVAIVAESAEDGETRFYFISTARYLHWKGRVYFTVIKPFHHLVVFCMVRQAMRGRGRPRS